MSEPSGFLTRCLKKKKKHDPQADQSVTIKQEVSAVNWSSGFIRFCRFGL